MKTYYAIQMDSELKNGWYEPLDNVEFLCTYDKMEDIEEQLAIYKRDDEAEGRHILYNVFKVNAPASWSEDLATDNAQRTVVYRKKEGGMCRMYRPFAWNNKDKDETKEFVRVIREARNDEDGEWLFCELVKQDGWEA